MAQHPYGSGYKDHMSEAYYADTWRHTNHPHIANETAYENDSPNDYYVEPLQSIAQRMAQMEQRQ